MSQDTVTLLVVIFAALLFVFGYAWYLWQDAKAMLMDCDRK